MTGQMLAAIGLGTMGGPMAGHLVRAGHTVQAFNRNPQRAAAWQQRYPQGQLVDSVAKAATNASIVFTCVGGDDDLREVARAAFPHMPPGSVLVDHSTTSATVARELAMEAEQPRPALYRRTSIRRPSWRRKWPTGDHGWRGCRNIQPHRTVFAAYAKRALTDRRRSAPAS